MTWILANYRVFFFGLTVLSIVGLGVYLVKKGMDIKEAQYQAAIVRIQDEAREKINDINEQHQSELQRILSMPDNGITCPYATDSIKRLYGSSGE